MWAMRATTSNGPFAALILGCVLAGAGTDLLHAEILDQSFLGEDAEDASLSSEAAFGQTFTVGIAGTLSRVEVRVFVSVDVTLDIRPTTSSGAPLLSDDPGDQLARVTLTPSQPGFTLVSADLSSFGISVRPGERLAIVLRGRGGVHNWLLGHDGDATYAGGQAFIRFDMEWRTVPNFSMGDFQFQTFVEPLPGPIPVVIDISSRINPRSQGVIPVAILTTATFDAANVDPSSVRFGPKEAMEAHRRGHFEDVDGDGELDLVLHFRTQATGIVCGQRSASLTGETFGGEPIEGADFIQTVGCR